MRRKTSHRHRKGADRVLTRTAFLLGKIASLLGISESTLRRRRRKLNLNDDSETWTALTGA